MIKGNNNKDDNSNNNRSNNDNSNSTNDSKKKTKKNKKKTKQKQQQQQKREKVRMGKDRFYRAKTAPRIPEYQHSFVGCVSTSNQPTMKQNTGINCAVSKYIECESTSKDARTAPH